MQNTKIIDIIENNIDKNICHYGFANVSELLPSKYSSYPFGISILRKLDDNIINSIKQGPTNEYYDHYNFVNLELTNIVNRIDNDLKLIGIDSLALKPTYKDSELDSDYKKTLRTEVSHKMIATRAGLGWIGKTDLLVTFKYGPRVRLASLLINYPLQINSAPIETGECRKCRICVDKCPGNAATGQEWDIHTDRDIYFNAFKCQENCRKLSKENLDKDISICGICIAVCPKGKKKTIR